MAINQYLANIYYLYIKELPVYIYIIILDAILFWFLLITQLPW